MKIHREAWPYAIIIALISIVLIVLSSVYAGSLKYGIIPLIIIFYCLVLNFFRNPVRRIKELDDKWVYSPADGKIVVIERVFEKEYFQSKRIQVSIFMSPLNVHVNRIPTTGKVRYKKYHPGKYLVAWHPKSSSENEQVSVVIQNTFGEVLIKQIAGAVARRISNYINIGDEVLQGKELGFIKFGSRVDILLPIDAEIKVKIGDKVRGNLDVIAVLN